ncbi:hypothetical protein BT96DRAFT_952118 [Gymnopus androsaceus JB14]|uniref:Uncharacterized protein n=1 Tax=Gymnopus androsaceus JB14 TaxID=1447944 RepID=A0A6A4GAL9_9AGAR|nr:hypothetical protein BT96DRAFT_952118 [Gymnopus androsaceus JB14]
MLGPMLKPWEKVVEGESIKEEVVVVPEEEREGARLTLISRPLERVGNSFLLFTLITSTLEFMDQELIRLREKLDLFEEGAKELYTSVGIDEWMPASDNAARLVSEIETIVNKYDELLKNLNDTFTKGEAMRSQGEARSQGFSDVERS